MKRPRIFYFVAAWCCFALLIQGSYLTRPARAHQAAGQPIPASLAILNILVLGFVVWETIGLVQLRRLNRWFAVGFFSWWSATLVWNATIVLRRPTVKFLPAFVLFSALVALNLLSAWYLSRRTFREFSVQFVAERNKLKAPQKSNLSPRRVISILFLILLLLTLPGLIAGFKNAPNISVLIGQAVISLFLMLLALHFWKPRPAKGGK
ncbi:MAG TPA: hypothetical protein VNV15_00565 [Opitutaceae bacterium]|jgi:hypothetical protein|nr:hypothetical protein [Opitutaceae bacterium]